jgi:energy-coupling factor transporter ATP-binding protein EcfA2
MSRNPTASFKPQEPVPACIPGEIAVLLVRTAPEIDPLKCVTGLLLFQGTSPSAAPQQTVEAKRLLGYVPRRRALRPADRFGTRRIHPPAYRLDDDGGAPGLLTRFELLDKQKKLGKELSKGMQQKLSICCALLHRPRLVVFDEPMVGLDPHAIKELKRLFGELRAAGAAILISTHMLDSVAALWDTAHIMVDGPIAASRTRQEEAGQDQSLEELFFRITEAGSHEKSARLPAPDAIEKPGPVLAEKPGQAALSIFIGAMLTMVVFSGRPDTAMNPARRDIRELTAGLFALYLLLFVLLARRGFGQGASLFRLADVNLIFAAPFRPRSVLFFGLIQQMGQSLLLGLFLALPFGWMRQLYGVSLPDLLGILLGYALTVFSAQLTAMVLYS